MNIFFLEFHIKELQQQISNEFERIHNVRAAKKIQGGNFKKNAPDVTYISFLSERILIILEIFDSP